MEIRLSSKLIQSPVVVDFAYILVQSCSVVADLVLSLIIRCCNESDSFSSPKEKNGSFPAKRYLLF